MQDQPQDDGHDAAAHELTQQPAAQHHTHLVHDLAHARPGADREQPEDAIPIAAGMGGKEHPQADDDDGVHGNDIDPAHGMLNVTEQAAGIGKEVRQVLPAVRAEQMDAESRQMVLEDVELRIHDLQQQASLVGQADETPPDGESGDREERHHDQSEAPTSRQRKDRGEAARAGVDKHGEQDAGEQEQHARGVEPNRGQTRGDGKDDQWRGHRETACRADRLTHRRG